MTVDERGPAAPVGAPWGGRRRLYYELVGCGQHGHALVGTDAAELRPDDWLFARPGGDGIRWYRCLRCDTWLPGPVPETPTRRFPPDRSEVELPLRGRPLRDRYVLRLIAVDRALHVVVLVALAGAVFYFAARRGRLQHEFYRILADIQGQVGGPGGTHRGIVGDLRRLFSIDTTRLYLTGVVVAGYAVLEAVEMVGLWLARRWAEYLTFVATTVLLPLEVYELARSVSALKAITFVINLAIVVYLLFAKRLFGLRGGRRAEDEERVRTGGWEAVERATPPPVASSPGLSPAAAPPPAPEAPPT